MSNPSGNPRFLSSVDWARVRISTKSVRLSVSLSSESKAAQCPVRTDETLLERLYRLSLELICSRTHSYKPHSSSPSSSSLADCPTFGAHGSIFIRRSTRSFSCCVKTRFFKRAPTEQKEDRFQIASSGCSSHVRQGSASVCTSF